MHRKCNFEKETNYTLLEKFAEPKQYYQPGGKIILKE